MVLGKVLKDHSQTHARSSLLRATKPGGLPFLSAHLKFVSYSWEKAERKTIDAQPQLEFNPQIEHQRENKYLFRNTLLNSSTTPPPQSSGTYLSSLGGHRLARLVPDPFTPSVNKRERKRGGKAAKKTPCNHYKISAGLTQGSLLRESHIPDSTSHYWLFRARLTLKPGRSN